MDWLFEKDKNNAEHLITILANESTSKEIFVKEPIRLFIELMWVKFKPRIILFVFLPYVVYLSLLYVLTGHLLNSFLINLAEMRFMKEVCEYENQIYQTVQSIDHYKMPKTLNLLDVAGEAAAAAATSVAAHCDTDAKSYLN